MTAAPTIATGAQIPTEPPGREPSRSLAAPARQALSSTQAANCTINVQYVPPLAPAPFLSRATVTATGTGLAKHNRNGDNLIQRELSKPAYGLDIEMSDVQPVRQPEAVRLGRIEQ